METLDDSTIGDVEPSGTCSANHLTSIKKENPDYFKTLDRVPERPGVGGGFDFDPEEALQKARDDYPDLNNWFATNADAFCYLGNYTERGGEATWVMAFGNDGSNDQAEVTVWGTSGNLDSAWNADPDVESPRGTRGSIGDVVTLSQGVRLLRNETEIRSRCFIDTNPDWTRFTFNISEGVSSLSLDPVSILSGMVGEGYTYLLVSKDGEYRAALDATNGQVLFSWEHIETFTGLQG
jgi:hypothetical protein